MNGPSLSVVMPNYNHARYLADAIEGIALQSRPPDEFLILDDASADDSLHVIEPYVERFPFVRFIRNERNEGVIAAHQRLFQEASGDYVFAGAADDVRLPGFLESAMNLAERFPEAGLVFGDIRMVDEQGTALGTIGASRWKEPLFAEPERFLREYLLTERPSHSNCGATVYRRDALMEVGAYRRELGAWCDTFAFRAIGLRYGVCYLPEEVVLFRRLTGSFSQQSDADPRKMLDIVARSEYLMKSSEFRDRFPADYVRHWRKAHRWQIIRDFFLGSGPPGRARPSFPIRNIRRLPRVFQTLALSCYPGDLSSFDQ